jgi:outer membrane protein assembly factor BamB
MRGKEASNYLSRPFRIHGTRITYHLALAFLPPLRQTPTHMNNRRGLLLTIVLLVSLHARATLLTNTWSLRAGNNNNSTPALSPDGTLFFGSGDNHLYAVSTNRYIKWAFETGLQIKSSPAIADDGTIYVGSRDRKFYAVNPLGKLKWSFTTEGWVDSSPAIANDGTVYFGSWDKKFYALKPDGAKKWEFATAGEIDSSPAIGADGAIYFGSHDKKFYALNPDGTKKWEFATGGQITSSPAIDYSGNIYFSSVDGEFYVLKPDGKKLWSLHTGGVTESSPVLGNDGVVYLCINRALSALTPDGKIKFQTGQAPQLLDSTPAVAANGRIFYSNIDGNLVGLDLAGEVGWSVWLKVPPLASPTIAPDGIVYAMDAMGTLHAVENDAPLATSPWPMFRANLRHTGRVISPSSSH